jgi:hypothetical protein
MRASFYNTFAKMMWKEIGFCRIVGSSHQRQHGKTKADADYSTKERRSFPNGSCGTAALLPPHIRYRPVFHGVCKQDVLCVRPSQRCLIVYIALPF